MCSYIYQFKKSLKMSRGYLESENYRQYNDQTEYDKKPNNDLQNILN